MMPTLLILAIATAELPSLNAKDQGRYSKNKKAVLRYLEIEPLTYHNYNFPIVSFDST